MPTKKPPNSNRPSRSTEPNWQQARQLYENGASYTSIAKQLGIHTSTVTRRSRRDSWTRNSATKERAEATAAAREARRQKWTVERGEEAERAASTAMILRSAITFFVQRSLAPQETEVIEEEHREGDTVVRTRTIRPAPPLDSRQLRDLAVSYGILIDKAQLLSGGATDRFESLTAEEQQAKVRGLLDELAARRDRREAT